jgi:hypothetical protein
LLRKKDQTYFGPEDRHKLSPEIKDSRFKDRKPEDLNREPPKIDPPITPAKTPAKKVGVPPREAAIAQEENPLENPLEITGISVQE